jgi:hypothetical protein
MFDDKQSLRMRGANKQYKYKSCVVKVQNRFDTDPRFQDSLRIKNQRTNIIAKGLDAMKSVCDDNYENTVRETHRLYFTLGSWYP